MGVSLPLFQVFPELLVKDFAMSLEVFVVLLEVKMTGVTAWLGRGDRCFVSQQIAPAAFCMPSQSLTYEFRGFAFALHVNARW